MLFARQVRLFSPECFVRIENNRIFSYPMKAQLMQMRECRQKLMASEKSLPNNTIVDLIPKYDLALDGEKY